MFLFYHRAQDSTNINFYKGGLFESLLKDYLEKVGYNIELRKKSSSLEYDIEGVAKATSQRIIGEAKAHSKSMSGQTISAFVGKLLPLGLVEKKVHGLFLSLSPLTPEAEDYFKQVKAMGLTVKTGQTLYNEISEALSLPDDVTLQKTIDELGYDVVAPNILKTDSGVFKLMVIKMKTSGTPSTFAVFNSSGVLLSDTSFCRALRDSLTELSGFDFLESKDNDSYSGNKNARVFFFFVLASFTLSDRIGLV
ncbi:restriction endonuclease, partial [Alteromonas mediterranea]|uniref:restriction endonuclease n=1 Tax=Alteromonas mediterranea TaxID=314275 RepID=UPI0032B2AF0A